MLINAVQFPVLAVSLITAVEFRLP